MITLGFKKWEYINIVRTERDLILGPVGSMVTTGPTLRPPSYCRCLTYGNSWASGLSRSMSYGFGITS